MLLSKKQIIFLLIGAWFNIRAFLFSITVSIMISYYLSITIFTYKNIFTGSIGWLLYAIKSLPLIVQLMLGLWFIVPLLEISSITLAYIVLIINSTSYSYSVFTDSMSQINPEKIKMLRRFGYNNYSAWCGVLINEVFDRADKSLRNESINLWKDTSVLSTVGISEITQRVNLMIINNFRHGKANIVIPMLFVSLIFFAFNILYGSYLYRHHMMIIRVIIGLSVGIVNI